MGAAPQAENLNLNLNLNQAKARPYVETPNKWPLQRNELNWFELNAIIVRNELKRVPFSLPVKVRC